MFLNLDDVIEGKIETIAFGGDGILRHLGFVVFVPFTAPGDIIKCQITEIKKSFAKARLLTVQTPGPNRITPPCPYFGICGGCQIQHLNTKGQLRYKLEAVKDALMRIGHLKIPPINVIGTDLMWAYRRHVTLHLRAHQDTFIAGYIGVDNQSLVAIQTCPIFNSADENVLSLLQEIVATIPNPAHQEGRVTILKNQRAQYILSFQFADDFTFEKAFFQHLLQHYPLFTGIIIKVKATETFLGNYYAELELEKLNFRITPQTFIQNHPEQSANIYRHICNILGHQTSKKILDLYCGFGMTSSMLSKQGHHVTGIEYNSDAIEFAKVNAKANKLHAHFIQADVSRVLSKLIKEIKPNAIVANPPRTGLAKDVLQTLLRGQPQEIIYVSCMPATLARDLGVLCQEKYILKECSIYDMFPQTAHVETVAYLTRTT